MLTKSTAPQVADRIRRRTLHAACGAHAVHDGMTDLIYVLLPLWQSQFGIGYAVTGLMRSLYVGVMAALQIQAGRMSNRWSRKTLLVAGTAIAGLGFLVAGQTGALAGTCIALVLGGIGASPQHPLASSMVADSHDNHGSRAAILLATSARCYCRRRSAWLCRGGAGSKALPWSVCSAWLPRAGWHG